jgi:hypothetical protein
MAGLEVVVRPVVFPDIRPAPPRSLPPQDDPEKGMCVITGGGSFPVQLSHSANVSTSKSKPVETERRSDEVTIYQMDDDGTVNRDNFVKMKVANRITMRRQDGDKATGDPVDPVGSLPRPAAPSMNEVSYYKRVEPAANIEVTKRDVIEKNSDAGASE